MRVVHTYRRLVERHRRGNNPLPFLHVRILACVPKAAAGGRGEEPGGGFPGVCVCGVRRQERARGVFLSLPSLFQHSPAHGLAATAAAANATTAHVRRQRRVPLPPSSCRRSQLRGPLLRRARRVAERAGDVALLSHCPRRARLSTYVHNTDGMHVVQGLGDRPTLSIRATQARRTTPPGHPPCSTAARARSGGTHSRRRSGTPSAQRRRSSPSPRSSRRRRRCTLGP